VFSKKEGGLRLKSLEAWNQTSMLRHVWSQFARSGSIWVAWDKDNYLRRKSFWSVDIPQNCSWSWRKILKLGAKTKRFLRFEVGNGEDNSSLVGFMASIWYFVGELWL
jgi:hypothetical protein